MIIQKMLDQLLELKDYTNIDTGSQGKKSLESNIYKNSYFEPGCSPNQKIIGLCGGWQQLDRHIENYQYLRCGRRNMVFVERSPHTYDGLKQYSKSKKYQCSVEFGDIKDVVRNSYRQGDDIYLVDYDSVESVSQSTLDWIDENVKMKYSEYFLIVVSARYSKYTKQFLVPLSDKLKLARIKKQIEKQENEYTEQDWEKYDQGYRSFKITKEDQIPFVHDILRAYMMKKHKMEPIYCNSYDGRSNMTLMLLKIK